MIKTPFSIYYDIETYNQYLKKTKQYILIMMKNLVKNHKYLKEQNAWKKCYQV